MDPTSGFSMNTLESYVRSLEGLAWKAMSQGLNLTERKSVNAILDGQPSSTLRSLVPLNVRREAGIFFTGSNLAEQAVRLDFMTASQDAVFLDPACGAGDLLVTCARRLPLAQDIATTLVYWGRQLYGFDLYQEFVRATRARLALLAVERGAALRAASIPPLEQMFPNIRTGDGLANLVTFAANQAATHIVLNPPYSKTAAPQNCDWASGKVSTAAIFLDACVAQVQAGTRITAILPDVLRTGSLYKRWRTRMEERAEIEEVEVFGLFDAFADIDVFILRLVVGAETSRNPVAWWRSTAPTNVKRIGDHFDVHVGPVVPHRDPVRGQWYPYIHVRLLPAWEIFDADTASRRRYWGRVFTPPFVVVRRTSAPGDKNRAVATIVSGTLPVAVENHLIVLKPRENSLSLCRQLLQVLRADPTDRWLDERIRCRHLTVSALRDLPWRSF